MPTQPQVATVQAPVTGKKKAPAKDGGRGKGKAAGRGGAGATPAQPADDPKNTKKRGSAAQDQTQTQAQQPAKMMKTMTGQVRTLYIDYVDRRISTCVGML